MNVDIRPRSKHCACGNVIGPRDEWCSHACYRNDVGYPEPPEQDEPQFALADPNETGPFG